MTRVVFSLNARTDIARLTEFLADSDFVAAAITAELVEEALGILIRHPEIGRRIGKELRELVISRGRSGYLALYHFDPHVDEALVLAIRHQRESGYRGSKSP